MRILREGELTVVGRLLSASNATFFGLVEERTPDDRPGIVASCVYKPIRGERPLTDFPDGTLACREVAAHTVSEAAYRAGLKAIDEAATKFGFSRPSFYQAQAAVYGRAGATCPRCGESRFWTRS